MLNVLLLYPLNENVGRPKVLLTFSGGMETKHWAKMLITNCLVLKITLYKQFISYNFKFLNKGKDVERENFHHIL